MNISDRKLKILEAIIEDFINTAQPVGSRTISKKYPLGISSATIRNEMADLEELGFLLQPHASAGRIPSDTGYRMYVDLMMNTESVGDEDIESIRNLLFNNVIEVDDIIAQSTKLLSEMTGLICMISVPQFKKCKLENLKLVKVTDSKVLLILVTDNGIVKSILLTFSNSDQFILDKISDSLLNSLKGSTIEELNIRKMMKLRNELPSYAEVVDYLIPILRDTMKGIEDVELHLDGKENILKIKEFVENDRAKEIYHFINNHDNQILLYNNAPDEQLSIRIGNEIGIDGLNDCSVIFSKYNVNVNNKENNEENEGKIILIGPKRMEYGNVISYVQYISDTLSELFNGISL